MTRRLVARSYADVHEFAADVRLVFENAVTFSPLPIYEVHVAARRQHVLFENLFFDAKLANDEVAKATAEENLTKMGSPLRCAEIYHDISSKGTKLKLNFTEIYEKLKANSYADEMSFVADMRLLFERTQKKAVLELHAKLEKKLLDERLVADDTAYKEAAAKATAVSRGRKRKNW